MLVEYQEKQNNRIKLTNKQRVRIAAKAKKLSKKMLDDCTLLFSADTILGWYRKLIAQKYDGSENRRNADRPQLASQVIDLVIKFKKENPRWGYQKITDQINYLGFKVSKSSVKNILIENGFDPEPDLTVRSTLHEFLKSHFEVITACDFYTIELLVRGKLIRCTVFFVIELATRKVFTAPIKLQPDGNYRRQVARILTDCDDGFLKGKSYLIHDRDPLYKTKGFKEMISGSGVEMIKLPAKSPDLNSIAERYVKSEKR